MAIVPERGFAWKWPQLLIVDIMFPVKIGIGVVSPRFQTLPLPIIMYNGWLYIYIYIPLYFILSYMFQIFAFFVGDIPMFVGSQTCYMLDDFAQYPQILL